MLLAGQCNGFSLLVLEMLFQDGLGVVDPQPNSDREHTNVSTLFV